MNIAFHTGKTAMIAQAKALNVYGNNIANVNTYGYQTLRADFADCIYERYRVDFPEEDGGNGKGVLEPDWQTGHGAYLQKTALMFSESHFYETGDMLDYAIAGEGFFAVENRWGEVNYTRDGSFSLTQITDPANPTVAADPDSPWYLVSNAGEYVLDYEGNRIVVPFEEPTKGEVFSSIDWGALSERIGTYTMPSVNEQTVRYEYSGDEVLFVEDAEKTLARPVEGSAESARISTPDGYFAVSDDYGKISYTHDGTLGMKLSNGKYYLGSSAGEFVLDGNFEPIELVFASADAYGDYFSVDWDDVRAKTGVFDFEDKNGLSTDDRTIYSGAGQASENIGKLVGNSGVTLADPDGFFALEGADGAVFYSRNIKFDAAQSDDGTWFLTASTGEFVLDGEGQRIEVPYDKLPSKVDYPALKAMIGVYDFPNPYGLDPLGTNRYSATGRSGQPVANLGENKLEGTLIVSNVDLATQMVKLIETQRAYQISSRVVTTADELARIANNLR